MASRVLDEFVIQEVAKTCPEPFVNFHKCLEDPTIKDKNQCAEFQLALQKCVKTQVTVYRHIEENCSEKIMKYQDCIMKDTEGNSSSKCFDYLKDLRDCAMGVIQTDKKMSK